MRVDQQEIKQFGDWRLYLSKLNSLGCLKIKDENEKEFQVKRLLAGFPFIFNELRIYIAMMNDGWEPISLSRAEEMNCAFLMDCNGTQVPPLIKILSNQVEFLYDANGLTITPGGKEKILYSAPLPF